MVVPSLYDAGPTTIYEGCECNVPMLVSDGCGGAELIQNNKGCIIFRTMDIDDLASKIEHFYECQQTYKSVGSYLHNKFGEDSVNKTVIVQSSTTPQPEDTDEE